MQLLYTGKYNVRYITYNTTTSKWIKYNKADRLINVQLFKLSTTTKVIISVMFKVGNSAKKCPIASLNTDIYPGEPALAGCPLVSLLCVFLLSTMAVLGVF